MKDKKRDDLLEYIKYQLCIDLTPYDLTITQLEKVADALREHKTTATDTVAAAQRLINRSRRKTTAAINEIIGFVLDGTLTE